MSSIMIVSGIIAVLIVLVCYAFIFQTIENKRKQKQRVLSALKTRSTNFKYMLSGFPPDFLTKDLTILVNRCLIDLYEQMSKLDPGEPAYMEELQRYTTQLAEAQRSQINTKRTQLDNPQQIKDIRDHLQELHKFIEKLLKRHTITGPQAKTYSRQIQKLILQISVDAYLMYAKQAQQGNKMRLAAHYYTLAKKLLIRENGKQTYSKQIAQLESVVTHLESQIVEEAKVKPITQAAPVPSREWDEFEDEEAGWKKKTVYD